MGLVTLRGVVGVLILAVGTGISLSGAGAQTVDQNAGGLAGHGGPIRAVIARSTLAARVISAGFDARIIEWDTRQGAAVRVLKFHDGAVNALAQSGTCLASAGEDARIALWCGDAGQPSEIFEGHTGPVAGLAFSADGTLLASASWDRTVRLWTVGRRVATRVIAGHSGPVNAVSFMPGDHQIVSAGYDGQLRLDEVDGSRPTRQMQLEAPVNGLAVGADGGIVTVGADGVVRFFTADLKATGELAIGNGPLNTVALAPDRTLIAVAGMRTPVTLIDGASRTVRREILGPGLPVWALAFSADGQRLVTGGADRAVRVWDPATGAAQMATAAETFDPATGADERGARVFRACRACHGLTAQDANRAGPTLAGLFGRRIASLPGYEFSPALKSLDIVWTKDTVARLFEVGPSVYTPGTKMPEQRLTDPADRQALVDWLARVTGPSK